MKIISIAKVIFYIFILLVLLVFMTSFVAENNSTANLVLFGHSFQSMSLSALLLIFFVVGGLVGIFSGALMVLRSRLHTASLERKIKRREEELKKLRVRTLKGLP